MKFRRNAALIAATSAVFCFCAFREPSRAAYVPSSGDLVKGAPSAVYYVTADGKRLAFPNETAYFSWYADFSKVKIVSDDEIASLPLSGLVTVRPGLFPVKFESSSAVYGIARCGELRALTKESIAAMIFGANWASKVAVIPDAFFSSYKVGPEVTGAGQYWWSREKDASPDIATDRAAASPTPSAPEIPDASPASSAPSSSSPAPTAAEPGRMLFVLFDPGRPEHPAPDKKIFERAVFGASPSVTDFFARESAGAAKLVNSGILGWYKGKNSAAHYWEDGTEDVPDPEKDGFRYGQNEMVYEALSDADRDIDFSSFDADKDGKVSAKELAVFLVIPKLGEPGYSEITSVYSSETPAHTAAKFDGVELLSVGRLELGTPLGEKKAVGMVSYAVAKAVYGTTAVSDGAFSLLSVPRTDLRIDPLNLEKLGWLKVTVIPDSVEVKAVNAISDLFARRAIRINRNQPGSGGSGEYFLIENREKGVYDNDLPDTGIAVWDVTGGSARLVRFDPDKTNEDAHALWRKASDSSPTAIELHWLSDNARSGVRFLNLGSAETVMSFTLEKKILTELDLRAQDSPVR